MVKITERTKDLIIKDLFYFVTVKRRFQFYKVQKMPF